MAEVLSCVSTAMMAFPFTNQEDSWCSMPMCITTPMVSQGCECFPVHVSRPAGRAENNRIGVSLVGGLHSVEDSIIRHNRQEIAIAGAVPKHLIDGEFLATGKITLVVQNALI